MSNVAEILEEDRLWSERIDSVTRPPFPLAAMAAFLTKTEPDEWIASDPGDGIEPAIEATAVFHEPTGDSVLFCIDASGRWTIETQIEGGCSIARGHGTVAEGGRATDDCKRWPMFNRTRDCCHPELDPLEKRCRNRFKRWRENGLPVTIVRWTLYLANIGEMISQRRLISLTDNSEIIPF